MHISCKSHAYLRHISTMYKANLRHVLGKVWSNLRISLAFLHICLQSSFSSIASVVQSCTCCGRLPFWGLLHFCGRLHFWGHLYFWGCLHFLSHLHFLGCLHFLGHLHFGVIFNFEVTFILRLFSQSTQWVDQIGFLQHQNLSWYTWDKIFGVWHCLAKLKTPSWISRVPEPMSEDSISSN